MTDDPFICNQFYIVFTRVFDSIYNSSLCHDTTEGFSLSVPDSTPVESLPLHFLSIDPPS